MNTQKDSFKRLGLAVAIGCSVSLSYGLPRAEETRVVTLTQTACQFIESEGNVEHRYSARSASECTAINERTGEQRVAAATPIRLKPGKTIFRVANRDVPYELGFWLRPARLADRITLPSVSGGGLATGKTKDYVIDLKPGEYLYSCPLNPTPSYHMFVED